MRGGPSLRDRGRRDLLSRFFITTGLGRLELNAMQGGIPEALVEHQIDEASHRSSALAYQVKARSATTEEGNSAGA